MYFQMSASVGLGVSKGGDKRYLNYAVLECSTRAFYNVGKLGMSRNVGSIVSTSDEGTTE
jgi:hypothetical protein